MTTSKKIICRAISVIVVFALTAAAFSSVVYAGVTDTYSEEYISSPFYSKLQSALSDSIDKTTMEKTLSVALSQEGYLNYSTDGVDIEKAREEGLLWTGKELRMNEYSTGNTEYTRWYYEHVVGASGNEIYYDLDWCAIFVSWCLYQAGYYTEDTLKKYYFTPCAEPRITFDADSWLEAFNLKQKDVYYTPNAQHKLEAWDWNKYYNTNVDPYELPYKPGGLVFFSWDGSGQWFDHVAFVVGYDKDEHILTYVNGNFSGKVLTETIDLDLEEGYRGNETVTQNSNRIMAYADYDEIKPLEEKEITVDSTTINWSSTSSSGITVKTDSESVICSVSVDGEYLGSNVESNMLLHDGTLKIGKSEIRDLSDGVHDLMLSFDDGVVNIKFNVYTPYIKGDADGDDTVSINDALTVQLVLVKAVSDDNGLISKRGNVLGDTLEASDVTGIQQYLAGYENVNNVGEIVEETI